jgi:digeranylgeranylglycerophospholipid reductase
MHEYDLVVVGGGLAGASAARAAASKGAEVLIIEEHPQVGIPDHCSGGLSTLLSGHSKEDLKAIIDEMDPRVVVLKMKRRLMWSPSGRLYEFSYEDGAKYRIDRYLFDFELAKLAVQAGAKIMLNTKVIDLIREDGFIKGVITSSKDIPEIRCKIVVAADGVLSQLKGIPKWEGMAWTDLRLMPNVLLDITGVKDVEAGVDEFQFGTFAKHGWHLIIAHDRCSCRTSFKSLRDYEEFKEGKWVVSKKLKDSTIVRLSGGPHPFPMGRVLPKKVKNGLILTGDACGLMGNGNALISGKLAGEAAAKAIEAGDVTEEGLGIYEELFKEKKLGERRVWHDERFYDKTEEELEGLWEKIRSGEISILD